MELEREREREREGVGPGGLRAWPSGTAPAAPHNTTHDTTTQHDTTHVTVPTNTACYAPPAPPACSLTLQAVISKKGAKHWQKVLEFEYGGMNEVRAARWRAGGRAGGRVTGGWREIGEEAGGRLEGGRVTGGRLEGRLERKLEGDSPPPPPPPISLSSGK